MSDDLLRAPWCGDEEHMAEYQAAVHIDGARAFVTRTCLSCGGHGRPADRFELNVDATPAIVFDAITKALDVTVPGNQTAVRRG